MNAASVINPCAVKACGRLRGRLAPVLLWAILAASCSGSDGSEAVGAGAVDSQASSPTAAAMVADRVFVDGRIYTVDPDQPWAEAMALRDGRIVAIGTSTDVLAQAGNNAGVVDLAGQFVMPGIIDAHAHPAWGGVTAIYYCLFDATALPAEVRATIAACVSESDESEVWIQGGLWAAEFFTQYRIDSPRLWLDDVSGDKAIALKDDSGHNYWVNSKALELLQLTTDSPLPTGAVLGRDPQGELNGVLYEMFGYLTDRLPPWTTEHYKNGIRHAVTNAHSYGVTAWKDASSSEPETRAYFEMDQAGQLPVNVATSLIKLNPDLAAIDVSEYQRMRDQYASDHVHTGFVKIFLDGIPTTSRTAAMVAPYQPVEEGEPAQYGPLHVASDVLSDMVTRLDKLGFTVKIHTAGDRSVHEALNAIETARSANGPSGLRHELAHAGFILPADIPRFAKLDVVADLSPHLWFPSPIIESVHKALGERGRQYWPNRDLIDAGAPLLMGSDWPSVAPDLNPWLGLEALVTRQDPQQSYPGQGWRDQAITLEEGVHIMTMGGARALDLADRIGSLEVGKSADFTVLSQNIFTVPIEAVSDTVAHQTWFEGQLVYDVAAARTMPDEVANGHAGDQRSRDERSGDESSDE